MASRRREHSTASKQQPSQVISVEEWESNAPLGDVQVRSVSAIKTASEHVPLPLKFTGEDRANTPSNFPRAKFESPRPGTPVQRVGTPVARVGTPNPATATTSTATHALHPKQPIQTPQQFFDWFALIERSVAHSQDAHFRDHVASVAKQLHTCDSLLQAVHQIDADVEDMRTGWRAVEEGSASLEDACEHLLAERDSLLELSEEIGARLQYFQELESATRMLNHPGESLVLQADFLYMVERVDVCIDYLKAHRHYREAEIYLLRFQQCMTRAMTLIRMYFVGSLRALSADIFRRISEKDVSVTAQTHLLYTRFRTVARQLAPLLAELERRATAHPDELAALLTECRTAYLGTRKSLLVSRIVEEIRGLDPTQTELVELTRAGCSYIKQLCTDEFELYGDFFSTGEDQLYQYLETLCDYLYDDLRPRILHESRLTALCEVCTVLQALMVLDVYTVSDDDNTEDDDDSDGETHDGSKRSRAGGSTNGTRPSLGRLHISHLLEMVLQDAQTRLFFKAQSVVQSDIHYYVPRSEDLAYPDILVAARKPAATDIQEKQSISRIFDTVSLKDQSTWFPTMRRTVWVLSQLHDFVKPAIFEDIAEEAVSLCRQSLVYASEMIKRTSSLDGQLFLIRHLLILKEIAHNLELRQSDVDPTVDLASVTETLASLLSRTTLYLPDRLFSTFGVTRAVPKDTRYGIDDDLRRACESVISDCTNVVCTPLRQWADKAFQYEASRKSETGPSLPVPAPEWATQEVAQAVDIAFRESCERDLRPSMSRLRLYLEDDGTVRVLVEHIEDRIMGEYASFRDIFSRLYTGSPKEHQVLSTSALRELLRSIYGTVPEASSMSSTASA